MRSWVPGVTLCVLTTSCTPEMKLLVRRVGDPVSERGPPLDITSGSKCQSWDLKAASESINQGLPLHSKFASHVPVGWTEGN